MKSATNVQTRFMAPSPFGVAGSHRLRSDGVPIALEIVISSSHDTRRASVNPLDEGNDETFVLLRSETDTKVYWGDLLQRLKADVPRLIYSDQGVDVFEIGQPETRVYSGDRTTPAGGQGVWGRS